MGLSSNLGSAAPQTNMNITSGINPMGIYTPNQTAQYTNQMVANNQRSNNLPALMKQLYQPSSGFSMGPASMAQAAGPLSQSYAQNNQIRAMQPLSDSQANAQNMLQGQVGRESNALATAGLMGQQAQMGWQQGMQNLQGVNSLLQSLYGGGY